MNKFFVPTVAALVCGAFLGSSVVAAEAEGPVFYGKANISIDHVERSDIDQVEVNSNASRFGFHGKVPMNEALSGFYRVEWEVFFDDGDDGSGSSSELKQRDIVAGVKGRYGSLFAGRHNTPFKKAQGKVDRFNDYDLGDLKAILESEDREDNTINYKSPVLNGFQGWVMLIPGENAPADEDGIADGVSTSLTYTSERFSAGLAYNSEVDGFDGWRVSAETDLGQLGLGALIQETEDAADSSAEGIMGYAVSAALSVTPKNIFKAQYSATDEENVDPTMLSLGWDHRFTKATKCFLYFTSLEDDAGTDDRNIGIGLEHNFGRKK